jgi:hypothetical protein
MAFPISPTNGQQATVGNVTYQYAAATNSWARIPGIANTISATGNITASYFIGNGSALTGIDTTRIQNGTSNVAVLVNSNVTVGVTGTSNVVVFAATGEYVTGEISASGNITGANLNIVGLSLSSNVISALNVTADIAGGNITTPGLISAAGNITGGNVNTTSLTGTTVSITGNISAGNISLSGNTVPGNVLTGGIVSATGNVTGGNIIGTTAVVVPAVRNTAALTISTSAGDLNLQPTGNVVVNTKYINGVTDPVQNQDVATKIYVDNAVSTAISYHPPVTAASTTTMAATTGGTISYTQPNGAGNGVGALLTTTGTFNLIDTANVQTVGTRILIKNEANAVYNGVYTWANATNIVRSTDTNTYGAGNVTSLGLNDYFFVLSGNVNLGSAYIVSAPTGTITFGTSNITFAQFSQSQVYTANTAAGISLTGTVINAKVDGITTAFDGSGNISVKASANLTTPNIGAATGTSVSVTSNITGGNLNAAGLSLSSNVVSTLNVTGNVAGINITTPGLISATGNITGGNILGGANVNATTHTGTTVSVTGNITGGNILGGANVNATTLTGITVSVTGAITGGSLTVSTGNVTLGNIINAGATGTGNIGNTGSVFNTVFAKATSAQYADVAELYTADTTYESGTVLIFGGVQEVTAQISSHSSAIAGVVSENPSHLMNAGLQGKHVAAVALLGRVLCQVQGTIRKGDLLVASNTAGVAQRLDPTCYQPGCIIGKSLENYNSDQIGKIEIAVGVK